MYGLKLFITIAALTSTPTDSCAIFKHGRVGMDIDGLSDKCCSSMSPLLDSIIKKAEASMDAGRTPSPQEQQADQQQVMVTFGANCCSDSDQGVFGSLVPSEPPEAAGQIHQMCSMLAPPADVLELFGITPLMRKRIGLAPTPVVARGHRQNFATSQLHNLGQELFGSHFEWARGWVNGYPEDDEDHEVVDLGAASITIPGATQLQSLPNLTIPCFKITIPIIRKTIFDLIEPCGNVQVPVAGITFKTPFGSKTLAGIDELNQEVDAFDLQCGTYSVYAMCAVAVFYLLVNLAKTTKRQALIQSFKKMASGHLDGEQPDPMMPQADKDQLAKDKLDPTSPKFMCPGNIYRLVTILHPGIVGYSQWGGYCVKAVICAYMQLYLPFNIMCHCFRMWHFNGIKSPLYFVMNGSSFFMQFGALANVCMLFASKCTGVIEGDAIACHYILSHEPPKAPAGNAAPASGGSKVTPLLSSAEKGQSQSSEGKIAHLEEMALKKIAPPQWLLDWNEKVWCLLNIFVTNVSSVMLMTAMYMKVATFSGDIMNIALVAVSLYFVFDLDDKVMDSDPHLRGRFRREVLKQTEATDKEPLWVKRSSSLAIGLIKASCPLGLLMITVISWRQALDAGGMALRPGEKFVIIGADPFSQ